MQKTLPGEGYHVWHAEAGDIYSVRRVALCMLYLNDVDETMAPLYLILKSHKFLATKFPHNLKYDKINDNFTYYYDQIA